MSIAEIVLTPRAFADIPNLDGLTDFQFRVGGRSYPCSSVIACFLSPLLAQRFSCDQTCTEFIVDTIDSAEYFGSFLFLGGGSSLRVNSANRDFFLSLSRELGNFELYFSILNLFQTSLTVAQALDLVQHADAFELSSDRAISFLASHFFELTSAMLFGLPSCSVFAIVAHPSLCVSSEDDLFNFIQSYVAHQPDCLALFQFVRFEYLSRETISEFVPTAEIASCHLWNALCCRLLPRSRSDIEIPFSKNGALNGIIPYLTTECKGNVHAKGIVHLSAKRIIAEQVEHVADLGTYDSVYLSHDKEQWICWDFQNLRLHPTHYTVRAHYLRTWFVETSVDAENWVKVHAASRVGATEHGSPVSFAVNPCRECRFIRLTATEQCHYGTAYLNFAGFEVFGKLVDGGR
jgi:hypothetical protein